MLDDPRKTDPLMAMLKEALPIPTNVTPYLARELSKQSPDITIRRAGRRSTTRRRSELSVGFRETRAMTPIGFSFRLKARLRRREVGARSLLGALRPYRTHGECGLRVDP